MKNLLRALIYEGQVSLTVADTTEMVKESISRHKMQKTSALVLGKALSAMTFMSSCLKQDVGEISLSYQGNGVGGGIGISGNRKLQLRGYIENVNVTEDTDERGCLGENGAVTVIRDDGYNIPFVGTCALPQDGGVDAAFEEYFRISEQLPTRIQTALEWNEKGELAFAGVVAVQPLPFADKTALERVQTLSLSALLSEIKLHGVESAVQSFAADLQATESREAAYRCNCSKQYLLRVLVTLGEAEMRRIIQEDGNIKVHCHYCNTDYIFTETDADTLFPQK